MRKIQAQSDDDIAFVDCELSILVSIAAQYTLTDWCDSRSYRRKFACRLIGISSREATLIAPVAGAVGDRVIAYLFGVVAETKQVAYVALVGVRHSHRRQGHGERMSSCECARRQFSRFRCRAFCILQPRKICVRRAIKNQVADGIFDASVNASANACVARADPIVPRSRILEIAAAQACFGK